MDSVVYSDWQQLSRVLGKGLLPSDFLAGDARDWTWDFLNAKQMLYH